MLCALTVRKLKPGTFDEFRAVFTSGFDRESPPEGWVRFNMVCNTEDPDEVISFGFLDGAVGQLPPLGRPAGYEDR